MGTIAVALIPMLIEMIRQFGPDAVHLFMSNNNPQTCPTLAELQAIDVVLKAKGTDYFPTLPAA